MGTILVDKLFMKNLLGDADLRGLTLIKKIANFH